MHVKRKAHITLDDIAKRLKVSRVTVSKALRGHPDISEKTAKLVRKVSAELGYSPNFIARNLSARRSNMLGVVVPKIAHFFFGSVIEAIYNTAFEHNYETILTVSQENAERERKHIQTLVSMRVDGIIVSISQETTDPEIFTWVRKMGIPVLFVDRTPEPPLPGFSTVLVDDRGGAVQAVEQAVSVGYRKLAMVGGNPKINIGKNRQRGFEEALLRHGIPVNQDWIVHGGFGKEDGYRGMMQLFQLGALPEFIFAATYPVALGVIEATKALGLRVPTDIDIICFGESDMIEFIKPSLSCIVQNTQDLGIRAVKTMFEIIQHADESPEKHVVIPTQLVLRETGVGRHAQASKTPHMKQTA